MKKVNINGCIIGEGIPKICVPIVGKTEDEILGQAARIRDRAEADIVELRADHYEGAGDIPRLLRLLGDLRAALKDKAILFTLRSEAEGGEPLCGRASTIYDINSAVIESAIPDLVDVELFSGRENIERLVSAARDRGVYVVMSNHDFAGTPEANEMLDRLRSMQDLGADIAKIAVTPNDGMELLRVLAVTETMSKKYADIPLITISMGRQGALSRITGQLFGSAVTFGSLEKESAPGQIPAKELRAAMEMIQKYCVSGDIHHITD